MEKKKILVVEDETPMLRMIVLELQNAGYEVFQAMDGQEALNILKKEVPDLIISDVLMPNMDGFTFYKELKKHKITSDIPVLILTARGKMEDTFRVVGADEFIAKPFVSEDFLAKIQRLVAHSDFAKEAHVAKRVLIAGTESSVIENMSLQLKKIGCHTDFVTNGPQIISKVVLFLPNILVMEVLMEGIQSHDVIKVIRQMPQGEKIPILIYSYYNIADLGSEDVRQRALNVDSSVSLSLEAGATEYIGHFNEGTFLKSLAKYLE